MKASSRTGVQLTSLLDLLFIMIFITLLNTKFSIPVVDDVELPKPPDPIPISETELPEEKDRIVPVANGQIRKLFISNNFYKRGRESYIETNLYAADDNQIWLYRLNLTGAGLVTNVGQAPIASNSNSSDGWSCEPVVVSREELVHDCRFFGNDDEEMEKHRISCERIAENAYQCQEVKWLNIDGRARNYDWKYRMELVRVFDDSLK